MVNLIPRTALNTIANLVGLTSSMAFTMVFSIFYFRILGSENFGLVSFCTTVLLIGGLFVDLGIGRTIIRELARRQHNPELAHEMRDTLFTLQIIHSTLAFACGAAIAASSRWLATHWLQRDMVDIDVAAQAIGLLGIVAALQLPREVCRSALAGLQQQVLANLLATIFSLLRGIATIGALVWVAPTPAVFLILQVIVSILETVTFLVAAWLQMPKKEYRPRFRLHIVSDTWRFAMGDGLAALLGIGVAVGDRVVLSRLIQLDLFGRYSLAIMIAEVVLRATSPFSSAFFPHFSDLIARNETRRLSEEYHGVNVVVSSVIVPAAFVMAFFPVQILKLVTGDSGAASAFASVLAIRAIANMVQGLQYLPHTLQLASGVSVTVLILNILSVIIYFPGMYYLTPVYGYVVPVVLWLAIVAIQMPIMVIVTHRVALRGEAWIWVKETILGPVLISLCIFVISASLAPVTVSWMLTLPWLATTCFIAVSSVLLFSHRLRPIVLTFSRRLLAPIALNSKNDSPH